MAGVVAGCWVDFCETNLEGATLVCFSVSMSFSAGEGQVLTFLDWISNHPRDCWDPACIWLIRVRLIHLHLDCSRAQLSCFSIPQDSILLVRYYGCIEATAAICYNCSDAEVLTDRPPLVI